MYSASMSPALYWAAALSAISVTTRWKPVSGTLRYSLAGVMWRFRAHSAERLPTTSRWTISALTPEAKAVAALSTLALKPPQRPLSEATRIRSEEHTSELQSRQYL